MAVEKKLQQDKTDDFIRIQDLFYLCLSKWYWFLISLIVTMGVAAIYLLKTPQVFTRSAMILIKDESQGKSMSSDIGFSELGLFSKQYQCQQRIGGFAIALGDDRSCSSVAFGYEL